MRDNSASVAWVAWIRHQREERDGAGQRLDRRRPQNGVAGVHLLHLFRHMDVHRQALGEGKQVGDLLHGGGAQECGAKPRLAPGRAAMARRLASTIGQR